MSQRIRELEPVKPTYTTLAAVPVSTLPVLPYISGKVVPGWFIASELPGHIPALLEDRDFTVWREQGLTQAHAPVFNGQTYKWAKIPQAYVDAGCGRFDLKVQLSGTEPRSVVLAAALQLDVEHMYRVHLDRLRAVMLIDNRLFESGAFIALKPGHHTLLALTDNRTDYDYDPLFVAPRLVRCSPEEIEAFYASRLKRWKAAASGFALGADAQTKVKIRQDTLIGTEGYIRVGRSDAGYWWFIDAENKPFYYKGVTSINAMGTQGGRRAKPGPYTPHVEAKYGFSKDKEPFALACVARLKDWGFNGLGSWTTEEFFDKKMYYTDNLEFIRGAKNMQYSRFPDVFGDEWLRYIDEKARAICVPQKENKYLLGYFTENEIGFSTVRGVEYDLLGKPILTGNERPCLLQNCLSEAEDTAIHKNAWQWLLKRHGSLDAIAKAWEIELPARAAIRVLTESKKALVTSAFSSDADAFAAYFAETFFNACARAIRRYDPNHLILGCRWAGPPSPEVLAAELRHIDVLSLNNYQDMIYERIFEYANDLDLPILIGEFCWSDDSHMAIRMPFENPVGLTHAERMCDAGGRGLRRLFRHPNVAGWTWYRWVSTNPQRTPRNCGLVDEKDEIQPWNVDGMMLLHPISEALRSSEETAVESALSIENGRIVVVLLEALQSGGLRGRKQKLVFGIEVESGKVKETLYGYGIKGQCAPMPGKPGELRFSVDIEFTNEQFNRGQGSAKFEVLLDRQKELHLTGIYQGRYNEFTTQGQVSAWLDEERDW